MLIPQGIIERALAYCRTRRITLMHVMGSGHDGTVWQTSRISALKVHAESSSYSVETEAYTRLRQLNCVNVAGFSIPSMVDNDDQFLAIEMNVVAEPFLVDFASAIFDEPPDFIEDESHTFEDFIRDRFDENSDAVLRLYYELADRTGIYCPTCIRRM